MEQNIQQKSKRYDFQKATELCYSTIFSQERIVPEKTKVYKQYEPFLKYIDFAYEAAKKKTNSTAKFTIVDRNNDYKLSPWLLIKIKTKKSDTGQLVSEEELPTLEKFGIKVSPIEPKHITVNNKEVEFYKVTDGFVCKADANASVIIDGDSQIEAETSQYVPETVIYNRKQYSVKKKIISIPDFDEKVTTCVDANYNYIVFDVHSDDKDQRPGEITLELKDNASLDVSVFDLFCSEEASEVYFDNPTQRYKITYRNKESGRIVIKCRDNIKKFDEVHLCANTIHLSRQKDALRIITQRPSEYHKPLISLAQRRTNQTFKDFDYSGEENLEYIGVSYGNRA